MKFEVNRTVTVKEIIEVEFPYYYRQDIDGDCVIHGKIEEFEHTSIQHSGDVFRFEIEDRGAATLGCYFTNEHVSSEDAYLRAKARLLQAVESA